MHEKPVERASERGALAESIFRESFSGAGKREDARVGLARAAFNRGSERVAGEYFVHHVYE